MNVLFKKSFFKDLKKLKNKELKNSVLTCILQVELAKNISQIKNLKKLAGFDFHYRI